MPSTSIIAHKTEGETPLECLERVRAEQGIVADVPMTYAGRLDPMAEGKLLILIGEECKKKDQYLGLDKEYEIEVLLGVSSDTGDILGIVEAEMNSIDKSFSAVEIAEKAKSLIDTRTESYPMFSSKPYKGKPLFMWAKDGGLADEDVPTKQITIYSIEVLNIEMADALYLSKAVQERISKVKGDFRQEDVLKSWDRACDKVGLDQKQKIKLRVLASSGAYMRTLAEKLGAALGMRALAWRIVRTKIGEF